MPAVLILVLLSAAAAEAPAQRNTKTGATRYNWGAVNLAVRPDTILGVGFWLLPDPFRGDETRTFSAGFVPEAVTEWARAVDTLIARVRANAPDAPPALLESTHGSVVSVYRRRNANKDPITIQLRHPKSAPLVLEVGEKGAVLLRDALVNAVPKSAYRPDLRPTDYTDEITFDSTDAPERLSTPVARYPRMLRERGAKGSVLVEVVIDANGRADMTTVDVIWSDHDEFTAAALAALEQTLYKPGRLHGQPVRVLVHQPFVFGFRTQ